MNITTFNITWRRYDSEKVHLVGKLTKDTKWKFKYDLHGVRNAITDGFKLIPEFSDIFTAYESDELFVTFQDRIPVSSRKDLLSKYNLDSYDPVEILKINRGITMGDNIRVEHSEQIPGKVIRRV